MRPALGRALMVAAALGPAAACAPMIHTDGQIPDPVKLASIEPGVQTQDDVKKLIGTPSSVSLFGDTTWYYITKRTSTVAFFSPSVMDQKVVAISFDQSGVVTGVRDYGMNDANEVAPVDRTTPTRGKSLTFLDQMLGNFNRYQPHTGASEGPTQ